MRLNLLPTIATVTGAALLALPALAAATIGEEPPLTATPQAECAPDDRPETGLQGQVSQDDHDSGRAAEGFTCNTELVGSYRSQPVDEVPTFGSIGGFKVHRYVDDAGNECAYYDSTLLFPTNVGDIEGGVIVLDMSDPANPVQTARLVTPAMLQPHESLVISEERGILAAITGTLATNPGLLDVYDISEDCRQPQVLTAGFTTMTEGGVPLLGHESGLSPDGNTFWAASTATDYVFAIDITDATAPKVLHVSQEGSHGLNISEDGNRTYLANSGEGLIVLDTSQVQARVEDPEVPVVSRLDWTSRSIPQNAIPFTSDGEEYLLEIDEFGSCSEVGAGRIISIQDETNPRVVSNLRLEVHDPENFDEVCDDPGTSTPVIQGYAGHYCHIPTRVDPTIAACSMIVSGLRIFDITDPEHPVEVAYFNAPVQDRPAFNTPFGAFEASNWAMSAPAFVPERKEIWYSDGFQGFYAVQVTDEVWPDSLEDGIHSGPTTDAVAGDDGDSATSATETTDREPRVLSSSELAATGAGAWMQLLGALLLGSGAGLGWTRRRRADA